MKKYNIGITTFKRRENMLYGLIRTIRSYTNKTIILSVNSEYGEPYDPEYLKRILLFCSEVGNVIPYFFPTFTSLSKMWNTIIINSDTEHNFIINDDIIIGDIFNYISDLFTASSLFKVNSSWSHFGISKQMAIDLNFFDERLLAYGEEDGDMTWKYETLFKQKVPNFCLNIRNIQEGYQNNSSKLKQTFVEGYVFRPTFNREQILKMYVDGGETCGMFGKPMFKNIEDCKQYPYEQFKLDNWDNL